MLTEQEHQPLEKANKTQKPKSQSNTATATPSKGNVRLAKMLRVEWLGQTVASLCWIVSVFVYGIESPGDWLQLSAASAWFIANVATIVSVESDSDDCLQSARSQ